MLKIRRFNRLAQETLAAGHRALVNAKIVENSDKRYWRRPENRGREKPIKLLSPTIYRVVQTRHEREKQQTEALQRAAEMLRVAAEYTSKDYSSRTIHYDEAECGPQCLADDCRAAIQLLGWAFPGTIKKEQKDGRT